MYRSSSFSRLCRRSFSQFITLPTTHHVRIVEVGPRDGLQNEKTAIDAETKIKLIDLLYKSGLRSIEAGAFVSPKWVPQMASSPAVLQYLKDHKDSYKDAMFSALTPNMKGSKCIHSFYIC